MSCMKYKSLLAFNENIGVVIKYEVFLVTSLKLVLIRDIIIIFMTISKYNNSIFCIQLLNI